MPGCRGKCELQITKILNTPLVGSIDTDPAGAPAPTPWATGADSDKASQALIAEINTWALPLVISGCAETPATCQCRQTEEPSDDDWKKKTTLTRDWVKKFTSGGNKFQTKITVEYKIAYVPGACEPPRGVTFFVGTMGTIPELGVTVLADSETALTPEKLEKIRKVLT